MAKKKQEQKGWCVFTNKNEIIAWTFRSEERDSKSAFSSECSRVWKAYVEDGWTCRKVVIKEY